MSRRVSQGGHVPGWPDQPDYQHQQSRDGRVGNGNRYGAQEYGPPNHQGGRPQGNMRRYEDPEWSDDQRYQVPVPGPRGPARPDQPPRDVPKRRKVRFRRTRRFFRSLTGRIISAIVGIFLVVVMVSAGQAAFKNNGQGVS